MNKVVVDFDPAAPDDALPSETVQAKTIQLDALQIEADDIEATPSGSMFYPLLGVTLTLATAALTYGGLLYVLKRAGVIPLHR